jgi:hypothetical protein
MRPEVRFDLRQKRTPCIELGYLALDVLAFCNVLYDTRMPHKRRCKV